MREVVSPVPGTIRALCVGVGEYVSKGTPLFIVEVMKMEVPIEAEEGGRVVEIGLGIGAQVEAGTVVLVLGPDTGS